MRRLLVLAVVVAVCAAAVAIPLGSGAVGVDTTAYRQAITVGGIQQHLQALQTFANDSIPANGHSTRVDGSVGFVETADYVEAKLKSWGYNVTRQNFSFDVWSETAPPVFQQVSPVATTYSEGPDFLTMEYSGNGDVTAPLAAAGGIIIPSPGGSASGCSASDFNGFPAGAIALVQRGTCTFRLKATNAQAAGAVGVVIFNEGNTPDRMDAIGGTLSPPQMSLPVTGASFPVGQALYQALKSGPVRVRLKVTSTVTPTPSTNIVADTPGGRTDRIVTVGGHIDSVPEGPGINDDGSGTAIILELAHQLSALGIQPYNKVRFAFWGGEEFGLLGSEHYVSHLPQSELKRIMLNLDFDMLGSPNFVRFVYDGDGSTPGNPAGPNGSGQIEAVFNDYFASKGQTTAPTAFDGRSDYVAFTDRGIPAGGIFSGAEGIKTAAQVAIYGGTAGIQYDPCYHLLCDNIGNPSATALDQFSDAAADATLKFAMTTSAVNGTGKASSSSSKYDFHGNKHVR